MVKPLVSFVIPVFNSARDIARCLTSIRQQSVPDTTYEVLIMDNGSTDQTPQIMHDLGFAFQVIPQVNVSTLRNRAAALAQGEYLAFVDSDVELTPFWLQHGLASFTEPRVVACGCFPGVPQPATWVQHTWDIHQRCRQFAQQRTPVPWLASMNLMVRREAFVAVSGFNESLETAEDVDLCYRLGRQGLILCNPAMAAIHWGEAPDLRTFWRKEVWRGLSNWYGVLSHGWRWDELPSLGYPLYMLCMGSMVLLSGGVDVWHRQLWLSPYGVAFLCLPACLLACRTAYLAQAPQAVPQLFVLYLEYGLARAYAVLKGYASTRQTP